MSLAHVILGLLQQQTMTGYDLKTEWFDRCISHIWTADQAQIYRTLDKLEKHGWIECTVEIQHDRPNRKVYRVTEAGNAEFMQWLCTHQPLPTVRESLLAQLHFAAQLPNHVIIQLLEDEIAAHRQKLADYQTAECQTIALPPSQDASASRHQLMQRLILGIMKGREEQYIEGLGEAIAMLRANASA